MPGKTPNSNGKGNGVRGNKDVEMKDSAKSKGKKPAKDGEDELTVVVPPSKASKQASADADGDVSMDGEEEKVDPVAQTVAGKSGCRTRPASAGLACFLTPYLSRHQEQLRITRSSCGAL
jgi:26S proteasome regulatory subunit N3